jgi:Tfp pilus assembly protein PilO
MTVRDVLSRVPARQLHLVGAAALLAASAALWFGTLRVPLSDLRALRAEQARLAQAGDGLAGLQAHASALEASVRSLARQLGADGHADDQLGLVGQIGALAAANGVTLTAIRPAPKQQALAFAQAGFDVEALGGYDALLAWLDALERSAFRLAINRFELHATKSAGKLEMRARIAAYSTEGAS